METKNLVLTACAALLFSGAAAAQQNTEQGELSPRQSEIFGVVDEDKDGYITREEADGKLIVDWTAADENNDGRLDTSEFSALEEVPSGSSEPGMQDQPPR